MRMKPENYGSLLTVLALRALNVVRKISFKNFLENKLGKLKFWSCDLLALPEKLARPA